MEQLVKFGAGKEILYDTRPHLGTDILHKILVNMRNYLINNGVEILFETRMIDLLDAETALREAEVRELVARYDATLAAYRLNFATGVEVQG